MSAALTVVVLVGTVILIAARPHGLNEGFAALLGMIAVLLIGTATPVDVWRGITSTAQVLVFLVAMMLVATIAEDAG
ncbi:MAG TPA: hypothetical protein VMW65_14305, partial [Chloroflexota bacterium]|nr:hypothetical protein [Chloroflexota bacterium]